MELDDDRLDDAHTAAHWAHARGLYVVAGNNDSRLDKASEIANKGHTFVTEWSRQWLEPAFQLEKAKLQMRRGNGDLKPAIELLESGLGSAEEPKATFRSSRWQVPTTRTELELMLARLYVQGGNSDQAMRILQDAVQIRASTLGSDHTQTAMAQLRLGEVLVARSTQFDIGAAEKSRKEAHEKLTAHSEVEAVNPLRYRAANDLFEMYQAMDRPQDAAEWQAKAEGLRRPEPESNIE